MKRHTHAFEVSIDGIHWMVTATFAMNEAFSDGVDTTSYPYQRVRRLRSNEPRPVKQPKGLGV